MQKHPVTMGCQLGRWQGRGPREGGRKEDPPKSIRNKWKLPPELNQAGAEGRVTLAAPDLQPLAIPFGFSLSLPRCLSPLHRAPLPILSLSPSHHVPIIVSRTSCMHAKSGHSQI